MWAEIAVKIKDLKKDFPLTYRIPEELEGKIQAGTLVEAPLHRRWVPGFVVGVSDLPPDPELKIKPVKSILRERPLPLSLLKLAEKIKDYYGCLLYEALETVFPLSAVTPEPERSPYLLALSGPEAAGREARAVEKKAPRQAQILNYLLEHRTIAPETFRELKFSLSALKELEKKALVILEEQQAPPPPPRPEAAPLLPPAQPLPPLPEALKAALENPQAAAFLLAYQNRLQADNFYLELAFELLSRGKSLLLLLPDPQENPERLDFFREKLGERFLLYHSQLPEKARREAWQRAEQSESLLALGARSAVSLPLNNLALIIVDREEDPSYKEESSPRHHARQVALMRAGIEKLPVLLASPAPSMESFYFAQKRRYQKLSLPPAEGPKITVLKPGGGDTPLSPYLLSALKAQVKRGERSLVVCYKKGYSAFLICESCHYVPPCPECGKPLNFYLHPPRLYCPSCRREESAPQTCPRCGEYRFFSPAGGIEKVKAELEKNFSPQELELIAAGNLSDLNNPAPGEFSLLGVTGLDTLLSLPDFRAPERAFSHLRRLASQCSPRTEMIVDTRWPRHPIFTALKALSPENFYFSELKERSEHGYPPFEHFVTLLFKGQTPKAETELRERIFRDLARLGAKSGFELCGADFSRTLKKSFSFRIFLKGKSGREITQKVRNYLLKLPLPTGWEVKFDVDPVSLI